MHVLHVQMNCCHNYLQRLRFWLEATVHPGMFSISSAGDIILRQPLDYETVDFYSFLVHVTDGRTVCKSAH
jgi:hypothetical protein